MTMGSAPAPSDDVTASVSERHDSRAAVSQRSRGLNGIRTRFDGARRSARAPPRAAGAVPAPAYRCSVTIPASSRWIGPAAIFGRIVGRLPAGSRGQAGPLGPPAARSTLLGTYPIQLGPRREAGEPRPRSRCSPVVMRIMLVVALVLAACGQQAGQPAQPASSDVVYVQDGDDVVRIDAAGVTTVSRAGVLSPDRAHRFTAESVGAATVVTKVDARSGSALGSVHLSGRFELSSYGVSSLSQNGEWLVASSEAAGVRRFAVVSRSEEHTSELQSQSNLVCRLMLDKKKHPRRAGDHCGRKDDARQRRLIDNLHVARRAGSGRVRCAAPRGRSAELCPPPDARAPTDS